VNITFLPASGRLASPWRNGDAGAPFKVAGAGWIVDIKARKEGLLF
jgi:hypothetical protein